MFTSDVNARWSAGLKCSLLAVAVSLVSACSTPKKVTVDVDPAVIKLSEAADQIAESYRALSYAESARFSQNGEYEGLTYELTDFPAPWQAEYVLEEDYYGELEPFLRGLSKLVGYQEPQIVGPRPPVPATITIHRARKHLADFLVDASYQAGSRAHVSLDRDSDRLRIIYPSYNTQ